MSINPYDSPSIGPADLAGEQPRMLEGGFRDQSTGLVLFGLLQLVLGGFCGLLAMMMTAAVLVTPGAAKNSGMSLQTMLPGVLMYLLIGLGFGGLGIGSIRARRWAWTLTVVLSWLWLAMGVAACAFAALWLPNMFASFRKASMPPQAMITIMIMTGTILVGMYVGLPGLFLLFYHRSSVRATCEARDPRIPWTDRCPKRVLALSLLLGFWAAMMPLSMVANRGAIPMFGVMLYGLPGSVALALLAVALAGLAWGMYQLKPAAWWGCLLLVVAGALSAGLTFSRLDLLDMYAQMGYNAEQLELFRKTGLFERWPLMGTWGSLVGGAVAVSYLLWVRRCFADGGER